MSEKAEQDTPEVEGRKITPSAEGGPPQVADAEDDTPDVEGQSMRRAQPQSRSR